MGQGRWYRVLDHHQYRYLIYLFSLFKAKDVIKDINLWVSKFPESQDYDNVESIDWRKV